jgi:small subunit ribosomal protein S6
MTNYELLYIVSNQYTEKELPKIQEKVEAIVKKYGGVIGKTDLIGKRKLAYPINKVQHGYYVVAEFELGDGENLKTITNDLKLDKEVLRAQIIIRPKNIEDKNKKRKKRTGEPTTIKEEEEVTTEEETKPAETQVPEKKEEKKTTKDLDQKLEEILGDPTL